MDVMEILLGLWSFLSSKVVPFVTLLGILIFVHELGHFLVALWCGVKVEVFSLGFGKKIFSFKRGDTTYCLSIIPLGGYVKMFGEQPGEQIPESEKSQSFTHKTVWQRIAIVLAGPLMNLFFAVFLFFLVANIGEEVKAPIAGDIKATSVAGVAGIQDGDLIVRANGVNIASWEELQKQLNLKMNSQIDLEIKSAGATESRTVTAAVGKKENPNILSTTEFVGDIEGLTSQARGASVGVTAESPLKVLGMKSGDLIKAINGVQVEFFRELDPALAALKASDTVVFDIERINEKLDGTENLQITANGFSGLEGALSLKALGLESADLYLAKVIDGTPAAETGLKRGDRLVGIGGTVLTEWEQVVDLIKVSDGQKPVSVDILREGVASQLQITPKLSTTMSPSGLEEKRYTIGIMPFMNIVPGKAISLKAESFGAAVERGWQRTWDVTAMTVMSFVRLFQAKVSPKNIGGVLSIGQAASESFKVGLTHFLQMMAIISVNLFILNLLPIPVLDGGHLLFYTIEVFRGSPLSMKKMEFAQQIGLALLMSLMVFALFNDFSRLFSSM